MEDNVTFEEKSIPTERYISHLKPHLSSKYNQDVAFYADLTLPANEYRFFVLDLKEGKVLDKGLCLNGREDNEGNVIYSNTPDSNCSSKGVAEISYRYNGSFGKAYKLRGLEESNNNMFRRAIVLHAWSGVPDEPVKEEPIQSQGCPTVNPAFLEKLSGYIDNSNKPILLYTL
ncbi:hypothetical protein TH63_13635 [Rufibacter radiotolerans]|uniref:L,D-transpeptidase catalytic domain n=1 Tax=Rufibacter radiotolerans TaxID=1379910 RepID=A0A0H4VP57_9BACT|nr:hypothetical protein TH63_13635 [Rufibacter radiotolerans]